MMVATWTYLGLGTPLKHFLEDIIAFFSCFFRGYVHEFVNRRYSPSFGGIRRYRKNHFSRARKNTPKTHFRRHFGVTLGSFEALWGGLERRNATFMRLPSQIKKNTPKTHFSRYPSQTMKKPLKLTFGGISRDPRNYRPKPRVLPSVSRDLRNERSGRPKLGFTTPTNHP